MAKNIFSGFSKETVQFFADLRENNNKLWFDENRAIYDAHVAQPAKAFVVAMGDALREIVPDIHADPRTNKSIFRINRDTRFSTDKSPYKTHMGILFWEGSGKKMESSGFYFHVEPPRLMLGLGVYQFSKPLLERYRNAVVHPRHGKALVAAISQVLLSGPYILHGQHYKRIPRGYEATEETAALLLHNGLYVSVEDGIPDAFYSAELIPYCLNIWRDFLPLHRWLVGLTEH